MHTSNYLNESHTIANGVTYRHCNIIFIHTNPSNFTNASKARSSALYAKKFSDFYLPARDSFWKEPFSEIIGGKNA